MLCSQVASVSVAGIASRFPQLQGAKPANRIIDRELHLTSCKRDVIQTFRICIALREVKHSYGWSTLDTY